MQRNGSIVTFSIPPTPEQLDVAQGMINSHQDNANAINRIRTDIDQARQKCLEKGYMRDALQLETLGRIAVYE